jgi:hypothetical protein
VLFVKEGLLARRRVAESWLVLGLLGAYLLFQAASPAGRTAGGVGPRYASAAVPFLMLGVMFVRTPRQRKAFYLLAGISVLANWLMVQRNVDPQHYSPPLGGEAWLFLLGGPSSSLLDIARACGGIHDELGSWVVGLAGYLPLGFALLVLWQTTKPLPEPWPAEVEPPAELAARREDRCLAQ